jgi:hypothetical protein
VQRGGAGCVCAGGRIRLPPKDLSGDGDARVPTLHTPPADTRRCEHACRAASLPLHGSYSRSGHGESERCREGVSHTRPVAVRACGWSMARCIASRQHYYRRPSGARLVPPLPVLPPTPLPPPPPACSTSMIGFGLGLGLGLARLTLTHNPSQGSPLLRSGAMLPAGCGWCFQTVAKIDRSRGMYPGPEARRRVSFTKAIVLGVSWLRYCGCARYLHRGISICYRSNRGRADKGNLRT